ncbi:PIG-L deacetylase family protein [Gemmatimonadota bacterium]
MLCLGAHSDDIEIGCGGSVLSLIAENPGAVVDWIVFGATGERASEARASAEAFLADAGRKSIDVRSFQDGFFPYVGGAIKEYFEEIKQELDPDIIFTHFRHDLHQDHRVISELTWNTFRNHLILEYEVIKYDGDLGSPNVFIAVDRATCRRKVDTILKSFKTQGSRSWFTEDVFRSLLRIRGVECNALDGYAEAFYCRKMVIR